jgi:hypothetical protein
MNVTLVLLVLAVICWFLAAIEFPKSSPIAIGWLGVFFFGLSLLIK